MEIDNKKDEYFLETAKSDNLMSITMKSCSNDQVIGHFCGLANNGNSKIWTWTNMWIDKSFRRKGLGTKILQHMCQEMDRLNILESHLSCHSHLVSFYSNVGFILIDQDYNMIRKFGSSNVSQNLKHV